jgi:small subunit ribosomal protein S16
MLRIRLSRKGKKKQPQYRVMVADVKTKRDGRFVENIGTYNPLTDPPTIEIKEARALYWLSVGAQPSDPVKHMLQKQGTYDRLQRLHKGETLEALVREYTGVPAAAVEATAEKEVEAPEAVAEAAKVEETVEAPEAAEVEETVEAAVEAVAETAEAVVEETVVEAQEAVEAVAESTDEETEA